MASKAKRKHVHTEFRINIPVETASIVTRVEVTRNDRKRILTKSTDVSIPIASGPSSQFPSPSLETPDPEPCAPHDASPVTKKARKGPSRSVSVCPFPFLPNVYQCLFIDNPRTVDAIQRGVRQ